MKQIDITDRIFIKLKECCTPISLVLLMLVWQGLGVLLLSIFGIDYEELSSIYKIIFLLVCDLSFIGVLFKIYGKTIIKDFKKFFNKNILKNIKLSFDYWVIGLIIMVVSNFIIAIITDGMLAGNEEAVRGLIDKVPLYMAFQVMIYAPLTEELIFRKSIRDCVRNKYLYILISGFIFGGLHVISSLSSMIDLVYLVPYCSLGFVFAALYYKTNNIFSTIVAHSFHNSLALILYLVG